MPIEYRMSYYSWITQGTMPAQVRAAVELFAKATEDELAKRSGQQCHVTVVMYDDVPPQIDALIAEPNHIALINPLGYIFARNRNEAPIAIVVALRPDQHGEPGKTYRAQLYTNVTTGIKTLS